LIVVAIALGLASRSTQLSAPDFVLRYAGDVLWGWLVFLIFRLIAARSSIFRVALLAGLFAVGIEVSQLYHARWIDSLRQTRLGALMLGSGFLWSDLVCYAIGIVFGALLELLVSALSRESDKTAEPNNG